MDVFNDFSTPKYARISVNYLCVENNYFIVALCYLQRQQAVQDSKYAKKEC